MARLRRHRAAAAPRAHRHSPSPPGVAPLPVDGTAKRGSCRRGGPRCQDRQRSRSRPQSGLPKPTSSTRDGRGGITRYLAIFQCKSRRHRSDALGPLGRLAHPCLYGIPSSPSRAYTQWDAVVASLHWLHDANGSSYPTSTPTTARATACRPETTTPRRRRSTLFPKARTAPSHSSATRRRLRRLHDRCRTTIAAFATGEKSYEMGRLEAGLHALLPVWRCARQPRCRRAAVASVNVIIEMVATKRGLTRRAAPPDVRASRRGPARPTSSATARSRPARGAATNRRRQHSVQERRQMTLSPGNTWVELVRTTDTRSHPALIRRQG